MDTPKYNFTIEEFIESFIDETKKNKYVIYKEDKNNPVYSQNFDKIKQTLLKHNIEFGKVPNKRVYYYFKLIERP